MTRIQWTEGQVYISPLTELRQWELVSTSMHASPSISGFATGGNMNETFEVDALLRDRLHKQKIEKELEVKAQLVQEYGEDEYADGQVIKFSKTFKDNAYSYVALKAAGNWYVTGQMSRNVYTWEQLVLFLVGGENPVSVGEIVDMVENPR